MMKPEFFGEPVKVFARRVRDIDPYDRILDLAGLAYALRVADGGKLFGRLIEDYRSDHSFSRLRESRLCEISHASARESIFLISMEETGGRPRLRLEIAPA
jgi:hypothetical protein